MIPDKVFIEKELAESGLYPYVKACASVDSTNLMARELVPQFGSDILVIADGQTAGRGSHGRSFYSPHSTGLYFSAVFGSIPASFPVTFAAGNAAVASLRNAGICTEMKWVNDIILNGKKAGGILCERISSGEVIIGIGINLMPPDGGFPDGLSEIAAAIGSSTIERDVLAADLYRELAGELQNSAREVMECYRRICGTVGRDITFIVRDAEERGRAIAAEQDGALLVETEDGRQNRFDSGNVSIRYVE
ncbi:MAG: biotin--[acetyl-CoA-carboxylase] ligase [Oscillospiraceae bacterium]|nr:biotin--[acetyl-CoA-carboxylase] ligase [Oscillospiraceae bacterium]